MSLSRLAFLAARKCRTARRQPALVLATVPLAWLIIGISTVAIASRPTQSVARLLGRNLGAMSIAPLAPAHILLRAAQIGRAITLAAKYAPFRSDCLPQALAAAILCRLGGVPYAAHLGASVSQSDKVAQLAAHAWVQCGPIRMTGGSGNLDRYGVVACFVPPGWRAFTPALWVGTPAP